jgi:hypothetical protein
MNREDLGMAWNPHRIAGGLPATEWHIPDEVEHAAAFAALSEVLGDAAAKPTWQRRLAIGNDGTPLLLVEVPRFFISQAEAEYMSPPEVADGGGSVLKNWLASEQMGWPLAEGVALLLSKASPEIEAQRRRGVLRRRDEARAKQQEAQAAADRAAREAEERNNRFRAREWSSLPLTQRALFSISLRLEGHDDELAGLIHEVASQAEHLQVPACEWWQPAARRQK